MERLWLSFLRGTRLLLLRSREREDSEPELELESESDALESDADETDTDSELEDDDLELVERVDLREYDVGGEDALGVRAYLRAFFLDLPSDPITFCFSLSFSLASRMKFAVPLLDDGEKHSQTTETRDVTYFFLNSSGTSTEGLPSALSLANTFGFSSISVREGRETYGRSNLHS